MEAEFNYHKDFIPYFKRLKYKDIVWCTTVLTAMIAIWYFIIYVNQWDDRTTFMSAVILFTPFIISLSRRFISNGKMNFTSDLVLSDNILTIKYYRFNKVQQEQKISLEELDLVHRIYTEHLYYRFGVPKNEVYQKLLFYKWTKRETGDEKIFYSFFGEWFWTEDEIKNIFTIVKTIQGKPVIF